MTDAHDIGPDGAPTGRALEGIRARAAGELPAEEASALEARLDADAGLRALADDYELVHRLTASLAPVPAREHPDAGPPRVRASSRSLPSRVRWAIAASLLALVCATSARFATRTPLPGALASSQAPPSLVLPQLSVELAHVRLEPPVEPEPHPLPVPQGLAGYRAIKGGAIYWSHQPKLARYLAYLAGRPMLVLQADSRDGARTGALVKGALADARVLSLASRCVPVLYWSRDEALYRSGPRLTIASADGKGMAQLVGEDLTARRVTRALEAALEGAPEEPALTGLARVALRLRAASAAEGAQRWGEAWRELSAARALGTRLEVNALLGQRRIADLARERLVDARDVALSGDLEGARDALVAALRELDGTPFADDLRRVVAALDRRRVWPRLVGARDDAGD